MPSDDTIIRLCRQGREEGFRLLLDAYQHRIYRRAYSFLRHRDNALDATQDVLLRVLRAIEHFRPGHPIWPWLRKITTNTCLNHIRAAPPSAISLEEAADHMTAVSNAPDPEQFALAAWNRARLEAALNDLPPTVRMVIVLRHEEDMTYDDIARTMDLPLGTVKTHLYRGRRALRDALRHEVTP